jgi:predicted transposase YdaD
VAQPFDITLKHLLEAHPADCLRLVGLSTAAPIDVIDADLATVIAEADKVFRVNDRVPWLMHFELQASYDADLPQPMLRYNVLLKHRHGLPVRSVVILLRAKADGPEMGGVVRHTLADERYLEFHYRVVRIWQMPVSDILAGGLGTLPLAPLAAVRQPELPAVIRRMKERLSTEVPRSEEAILWTATYVLMGLRYDQTLASELLKGALAMEESVTYQEIIDLSGNHPQGNGQGQGRGQGRGRGRGSEANLAAHRRQGIRCAGCRDERGDHGTCRS